MPSKTLDAHIETSPQICSGQPHIAGHRITVHQIVVWHDRMGVSADEIATRHGLSVAAIYAALAYYFDNRNEVDQLAAAADSVIEQVKAATPSKLKAKLAV